MFRVLGHGQFDTLAPGYAVNGLGLGLRIHQQHIELLFVQCHLQSGIQARGCQHPVIEAPVCLDQQVDIAALQVGVRPRAEQPDAHTLTQLLPGQFDNGVGLGLCKTHRCLCP